MLIALLAWWAIGSVRLAGAQPPPRPQPLPAATAPGPVRTRVELRQQEGVWWLVAPDGRAFFSLGVCCVNQGLSRQDYDVENPGYAAWQHYPDARHWAEATTDRLHSWGFTTIGAWSDYAALRQTPTRELWMTPVLHIGSTAGAPWWDMWDPKIVRRIRECLNLLLWPLLVSCCSALWRTGRRPAPERLIALLLNHPR